MGPGASRAGGQVGGIGGNGKYRKEAGRDRGSGFHLVSHLHVEPI